MNRQVHKELGAIGTRMHVTPLVRAHTPPAHGLWGRTLAARMPPSTSSSPVPDGLDQRDQRGKTPPHHAGRGPRPRRPARGTAWARQGMGSAVCSPQVRAVGTGLLPGMPGAVWCGRHTCAGQALTGLSEHLDPAVTESGHVLPLDAPTHEAAAPALRVSWGFLTAQVQGSGRQWPGGGHGVQVSTKRT